MPKLNQILAIEAGLKTRSKEGLTKAYHALQKTDLLSGISRVYTPLDENDRELLPPETKNVQATANDMIADTSRILTELFDVTATKDYTNCEARADIIVDGKTLLVGVPATYLLFLEKQLVDLVTFIKRLPVLDAAEEWRFDEARGVWATATTETQRTRKVMKNHVKAEATDKHPAQVETYTEDVPVGRWRTVKFSGALPKPRVEELLERVTTLQKAVLMAREQANMTEAKPQQVGGVLFDYLFGGNAK